MKLPRLATNLFTQEQMVEGVDIPPWLVSEYDVFRKVVLDPSFPCYFGAIGERNGELRYTYTDENAWEDLPNTLRDFLILSRDYPETRHALALFVKPAPKPHSLEKYQAQFWEILNYLHEHDPTPWPTQLPSDPESPLWEFCFDGEPMFIFSSTPAYTKRISRHLGDSLVLLFQPRRVFNGIEGGTIAGTRAREIIRQKMVHLEGMPAHPDMGSYGDPSTHEWKQYFLPDDNTPVTGKCPFHMNTHELKKGE
ncbi:YqcI/YcgG family protein [Marininema halotolerans]|uniref:YqcI/YcgG family protein n=1 Tax=Marininema halotolerans TaxID=1155944 RepID=A0A1I6QPC7_9BACL|nr:YqcI/YcgG family protein [Marininema halotolerans]SFS54192.1 hypothetical protein SAMN05444972_103281 [Marininema halotolerans]